jgi:ABC-type sugar transport system substrate-binding protein
MIRKLPARIEKPGNLARSLAGKIFRLVLTAGTALLALNARSAIAADSAAMIQQIQNNADPTTVPQQIKDAVFGNGVVSGLLMAKALHGKGEVGLIYHAADFFVTRQRYEGFKAIIAKYPGIKIVAEQGIAGPEFTGDAKKAASAILTSHPKVSGLWAVWDVPAEGVLSAVRTAGREPSSLSITTCDLGANIAIDMAQDGFVKGTSSPWPIRQAETEAILAGYGLIDKTAPAYLALPAVPVAKENILAAWKQVHGVEAPGLVIKALQ